MDDLYLVGAAKPLGYLPLDTIIRAGCEPVTVAADLQSRGLKTRICSGHECSIESGALYVWDYDALRNLMDANRTVLEDAGWPFDADQFVERVIREHISRNDFPNLYLVIARAFGERV
jgi:hypothetical protein